MVTIGNIRDTVAKITRLMKNEWDQSRNDGTRTGFMTQQPKTTPIFLP